MNPPDLLSPFNFESLNLIMTGFSLFEELALAFMLLLSFSSSVIWYKLSEIAPHLHGDNSHSLPECD